MERDEILKKTVAELKAQLTTLGLSTNGRKVNLQERLLEHFGFTSEETQNELYFNEEGDDDGNATIINSVMPSSYQNRNIVTRSIFTLRDIEDSISTFSGVGQPTIEEWLEEFESNADAVQWDELQRFIYAKQLLKGAAKIFTRSQRDIKDWPTLKNNLKSEFGITLSQVEVHRMLRCRRRHPKEDLIEYLYELKGIGESIKLDDASLIQYFIEGISDSKLNKACLYQARSLIELKHQIQVYTHMWHDRSYTASRVAGNKLQVPKEAMKKCFKCGSNTHLARSCESEAFKCFKCGEPGHRAAECKTAVSLKREKHNINTLSGKNISVTSLNKTGMIFKDLSKNGCTFSALIDTGCDLCLMRHDTLLMLGDFELNQDIVELVGVGNGQIRTLGSFTTTFVVDKIVLELTFHIVKERDMRFAAIMGNNVLELVDLIIKGDKVRFNIKSKGVCRVDGEKINRNKIEHDAEVESRLGFFDEFQNIWCLAQESDKQVVMDLEHIQCHDVNEVSRIINNYIPKCEHRSPVEMKLLLLDEKPVYCRPNRLSEADKLIVDKQIVEWLEKGIIQPSMSEYASRIVLVNKKDGTKRLCCDYRRLNQIIVRDNFPMPLIEEVLDKLQDAKIFITLDLADGFFHVPMEINSRKYTAFVTSDAQYEFLYMPFGICNSPAVFSRYIAAIFRELVNDKVMIVYMDDLIIPAKDVNDAFHKLKLVLGRAAGFGLRFRWSKCQFLQKTVNFLGHIIEQGTVKPSKEKTLAIEKFPVPVDRKTLQRFLGLTSYFRKFINGYAVTAKPLSDMLRKDHAFKMGEAELIAFQQLKSALINTPVLRLYNPKAQTEVHTDASKFGYGAILLQKDFDDQQFHPVQYMSRKTKPPEEQYHSYELEVLAIIEALKKWRTYLAGLKIKIVTDCNAFAMTMRKDDVPPRVARWALFLQDFDYTIEHRRGSKMQHVDALSRMFCLLTEDSLSYKLQQEQLRDEWISAVTTILKSSQYKDFFVKGGLLYKDPVKELVVLPSSMEAEVIRVAHNQGHFSCKKTSEMVERQYYVPDLQSKVEKVVRGCIKCIIMDSKLGKKEGFLSPIDKEDYPLGTYHIDHVGPMQPTKKQYNYLLVIIDAFSKFVWLYPTRSTGAEEVIQKLSNQSAIFGNPKRIITDRGVAFTANSFKAYCEEQHITHLTIVTGVPRGNGQVERIHKIVVPMLAKLSSDKPDTWYKWVEHVQRTINSSVPRSTKYSPFRLLTGVEMRTNALPQLQEMLKDETITLLEEERTSVRTEAKHNILKLQQENCKRYNASRKAENQYQVGDLVAVKRTQFGTGMRLRPKFLGPYKVERTLAHGRYEVKKVGDHEGPGCTSTVAENMKRWIIRDE